MNNIHRSWFEQCADKHSLISFHFTFGYGSDFIDILLIYCIYCLLGTEVQGIILQAKTHKPLLSKKKCNKRFCLLVEE